MPHSVTSALLTPLNRAANSQQIQARSNTPTRNTPIADLGSLIVIAAVWLACLSTSPMTLAQASFMSKQSNQSDFRPAKRAEPAFLPVDQAFTLEIDESD